MIRKLRQGGDAPEAAQWRADLERLNAVISLVAAVEYPMSGLPRDMADEAIGVLKELAGRPDTTGSSPAR